MSSGASLDPLGNPMPEFEPVLPSLDDGPDDDNLGIPLPDLPTERPITRANPEGKVRREGMGFSENVSGSFKSNTQAGVQAESAQMETLRGSGNASRGGFAESQIQQLPSRVRARIQQEATPERQQQAQDDAYNAITDQIAYDLAPTRPSVAGIAGGVLGAIASPENLLGLPIRQGASIGRVILTSALEGALFNTVTDPVIQAGRVQSGAQESYNLEQTLLAAPTGAVLGGALGAASQIPRMVRGTDPMAGPTPTLDEIVATQEATIAAQNGEVQAPVVAPEQAVQGQGAVATQVPQEMPAQPMPQAQGQQTALQPDVMQAPVQSNSSVVATQEADTVRQSVDDPAQVRKEADLATLPPTPSKPAGVFMFDPTRLLVDAERFQFKADGDSEGVLPKLKNVKEWDESKANQIIAWQQADGKIFVVDGHQRTGLARRIAEGGSEPVQIPGLLYRETDGFSADDVMIRAAAKNIAEGSGSIIDAAKIIKRSPVIGDELASISDYKVKQARELASLSDEAWRMTLNEVVTPEQASIVARFIPDGDRQIAAIDAIAKIGPSNADETAALVQKVKASELSKAEAGKQGGLFGDDPALSTVREEIRIVAQAVKTMRSDKALFARVSNDADRIESASTGMKVDRDAALGVKDEAGRIAAYIQSRSDTKGPIRTALLDYAKGVKDGTVSTSEAARRLIEVVRSESGGSNRGGNGNSGSPKGQPDFGTDNIQPLRLDAGQSRTGSLDVQPMAATKQGAANQLTAKPAWTLDPNRRFANRRAMAGEDSKPVELPKDATPDEIRDFNVTERIKELAAVIGRKVEVDGRFTLKRVAGEYKGKDGVIRIRYAGDFEVFSHELAHAIDKDLIRADKSGAWAKFKTDNATDLAALDANGTSKVSEGIAELMRLYINNPKYAQYEHPILLEDLGVFLKNNAPDTLALLQEAHRVSQIDNGLPPMQQIESMIVPAVEPRGLDKFAQTVKEEGLPKTLGVYFDKFYTMVIDGNHPLKRFVDELKEAQFTNTGKPMEDLRGVDPYKKYMMMHGAKQTAVDEIMNGSVKYGDYTRTRINDGLQKPLSLAMNGDVGRLHDRKDPLKKAFDGYLVARHAKALYSREKPLPNQPIRVGDEATAQAVLDYEAMYPQFKEAADGVFKFTGAMWDKLYDAGITNEKVYSAVKEKGEDYVPLFRDMNDKLANSGGGGSSALENAGKVKAKRGSARNVLSPIESVLLEAAVQERLIAHNDSVMALKKLADLGGEFSGRLLEVIPNDKIKAASVDVMQAIRNAAKQQGKDELDTEIVLRTLEEFIGPDTTAKMFSKTEITAGGERIIFGYENGERIAMKVGNDKLSKDYFDILIEAPASQKDLHNEILGRVTGTLSSSITSVPSFLLANILTDGITRPFVTRMAGVKGRIPLYTAYKGIHQYIANKAFADAYAAAGGVQGGVATQAARNYEQAAGLNAVTFKPTTIAELKGSLKRLGEDPKELGKTIVLSPVKAAESAIHFMEKGDTITRVGHSKAVYDYLRKNGFSEQDALFNAFYEGNDSMNYGRKGNAMQGYLAAFPFINAGAQGTDRALRALIGEPFMAAVQAYKRGGYANLDQSKKQALQDAVVSWGYLTMAAVGVSIYHTWVSDSETYQRRTQYMKDRYFIIPLWEGKTAEDDYYLSIPKPFDMPGALFNMVERYQNGVKRADPDTYKKTAGALIDGFIPRQFTSLEDFLGSNIMATGYGALSGVRLGFAGGDPAPIVPDALKSLPKEQQYTANTSYLAKKMGEYFGVSPMMADYVMNGVFGTASTDSNALITGAFGDNPNMTMSDALLKVTIGRIYRKENGSDERVSEMYTMMGRTSGKYVIAARGYVEYLKRGETEKANEIYKKADEFLKPILLLNGSAFSAAERKLNPLYRAEEIAGILGSMQRDLGSSMVKVAGKTPRGEVQKTIELDPPKAEALTNVLNKLKGQEVRNSMTAAGLLGYRNIRIGDLSDLYKDIRNISPEVANEIEAKYQAGHVYPIEMLKEAWPKARARLEADKGKADLSDLLPAGKESSNKARRKIERERELAQ